MKTKQIFLFCYFLIGLLSAQGQTQNSDSTTVYKKRVLESIEIDILSSYYWQDGNNAAVSGGIGTEGSTPKLDESETSVDLYSTREGAAKENPIELLFDIDKEPSSETI